MQVRLPGSPPRHIAGLGMVSDEWVEVTEEQLTLFNLRNPKHELQDFGLEVQGSVDFEPETEDTEEDE